MERLFGVGVKALSSRCVDLTLFATRVLFLDDLSPDVNEVIVARERGPRTERPITQVGVLTQTAADQRAAQSAERCSAAH